VRFWDTSSIVPLLTTQPASAAVLAEFERDPRLVVWWATEVECTSALARLERERALDPPDVVEAMRRLAAHAASWQEVHPTARVRQTAERLLRTHAISGRGCVPAGRCHRRRRRRRPLDVDRHPDDRLAHAAEREGFPVIEPG
jgi:uncharacterized protein with PIN domain